MKKAQTLNITWEELQACLARVKLSIEASDYAIIEALVGTYLKVAQALSSARVSIFGRVYHVDGLAKERNLSPQERLFLHQEKSSPIMERLRRWLVDQLLEDKVEPNSGLGKAVGYMLKRWEQLTLFLSSRGDS